MAAPDGKVLASASVQAPFSGMVQVQNKVYPVLDLRKVVNDQSASSAAAEAARQLIVVQVPLEKNPGRWSRQTRNWEPIATVRLNPERKRPSEENLCNKAA